MFHQFFIPWFLFNWIPFPKDTSSLDYDYSLTASENYVKHHSDQLNQEEKQYIETANKMHYSFYQVKKVIPSQSIEVSDILLDTEHTVHEIKGSEQLKTGGIVFGRIITINGNSVFLGMMPHIIPPSFYYKIIAKKKALTHTYKKLDISSLLKESQRALISWCLDLIISMFSPPIIQNTDGDLIEFSKAYFTLKTTPEEAVKKLKSLTIEKNIHELLDYAEYDKNGSIQKITFPWSKAGNKIHKFWSNTTLGNITITNSELILETNSKKRLDRGRKLIEKKLCAEVLWKKKRNQKVLTPTGRLKIKVQI